MPGWNDRVTFKILKKNVITEPEIVFLSGPSLHTETGIIT
jgi:hypothetical protein